MRADVSAETNGRGGGKEGCNLVVGVVGGVDFVADERSATDHFADGEDAVGLDGVDGEFFPVAIGEELGPVGFVGGLGPELAVGRGDGVERGGRCE